MFVVSSRTLRDDKKFLKCEVPWEQALFGPRCFSLRGRRLKGKGKGVLGKGVLGARETRGAREEGGREKSSKYYWTKDSKLIESFFDWMKSWLDILKKGSGNKRKTMLFTRLPP